MQDNSWFHYVSQRPNPEGLGLRVEETLSPC